MLNTRQNPGQIGQKGSLKTGDGKLKRDSLSVMLFPPRIGDKLVALNNHANNSYQATTGALYSENGRGANQWGQWIRINGQVYALWSNVQYDE